MKILIFTNHFQPENFRVNDVALHLSNEGHKVTVVTAIPDYPKGKFYDSYGYFHKRIEHWNGITIIRSFIVPRGNGRPLRLMINYLSMLLSSVFNALILAFTKKFDAVFVHETSPIMIGIPAVLVKKIQHIPLYFWVLDLWPESLSAAGNIRNPRIIRMFENLSRWIYCNSTRILMSSQTFRESILKKGDFKERLVYFPQWGEDLYLQTTGKHAVLPPIPQGFRIMYAGNLGEAQNFENVLQVALKLRNSDVQWLLVGDGRKRPWIEKFIEEHHLQETVHLLGSHPSSEMPSYFNEADAMFLSLKDEPIFNLTVPAKLQAYMASAKPILAMIGGEAMDIINTSECGYASLPNDVEGMAGIILEKVIPHQQEFMDFGLRGKEYYMQHFSKEKCMKHLDEILCAAQTD